MKLREDDIFFFFFLFLILLVSCSRCKLIRLFHRVPYARYGHLKDISVMKFIMVSYVTA